MTLRRAFCLCSLLLAGAMQGLQAQALHQKYWIYFEDKPDRDFSPGDYFDSRAIERRIRHGIPLVAESDLPVSQTYIEQVSPLVKEVRTVSRWLNGMCVLASPDQIAEVERLTFVSFAEQAYPTEVRVCGYSKPMNEWSMNENAIDYARAQLKRMQGTEFEAAGINGKGVRVAVFDVGFKSVTTNPAFEHLRTGKQILKTWDFVKNRENVDGYNNHGTLVLSCIAGKLDGQPMGLAQGAEFLLARTETWTEFYGEEENWLAAAEWADKEGADIINSSLGYTYHRYFREQMNGKTSLVSRAASIAAAKGMLVVNAAGNDGDQTWKVIGCPADVDSVLSVGGLDPYSGVHTSFSSFGPTADKRLKPNVTAYGHVVGSGPDGIEETQGTSFSSPLVAGFAACAMQCRPTFTNMQLFDAIQQSADLYPYFDYAHGYGVPRASWFLRVLPKMEPTLEFEDKGDYIEISLRPDTASEFMDTLRDIWFTRRTEWPDYVFFHVENSMGYLDKYWVVESEDPMVYYDDFMDSTWVDIPLEPDPEPESVPVLEFVGESPFQISKRNHQKPFIIRAWYRGYTGTYYVR